jgi:basic membrane protein A
MEEKLMSKKLYVLLGVMVVISMMLAACGTAATPTAAPATEAPTMAASTEAPTVAATAASQLLVGEVTDLGGIDDKSFNASGWLGVQQAITDLGITGKYLESTQESDYAKNIQEFLNEKAGLIITVGYLLGVDTATAAKANPNTDFAIVDYAFPDCATGQTEGKDCGSSTVLPNVVGLVFQTDSASFLGGYLAAGMTKTGTVATFGGIDLPTVSIYMKGFEAGVKYYNQKHNTTVKLLGWDDATQTGVFVGNFDSTDDGNKTAQSLQQEGADIIMPVAGPVGLGSAAYCQSTNSCLIIGVDQDWFVSAPEYQSVELSSVMKKINVAVEGVIKSVLDGTFKGGTQTSTIVNGGVDLAPFHDFNAATTVPDSLKTELTQVKADLVSGAITVDGVLSGK